jgi:uncharacterized membrane protein YfbV (UPF0208 family)
MFQLTFAGLIIITGIVVEIIKRAKLLPIRFLPFTSVIAGIVISCLAGFTISPVAILTGIVIGASAAGVYDVGKKTILNK